MGMNAVLVTGAGGFTGRHVCRRLTASGWEVTALISPRSVGAELPEARRIVSCELTDRASTHLVCRELRPDAVLHLAGQNAVDVSWRSPDLTLAVNMMATAYLLEGARSAGIPRIVVAGSMLRVPPRRLETEGHPYGFAKTLQVLCALAWHRWYGLPVTVVEPCNLIGPGGSGGLIGRIARWAAAAEAAGDADVEPFALSSLTEARDFLDVRDAAAAYELLLTKGEPGGTYALESGVLRTLGEVKEAFDRAVRVPLPWRIGRSDAPSPQPRDTSPIRRLGWSPRIPFERSVMDALEEERRRAATERRRDA